MQTLLKLVLTVFCALFVQACTTRSASIDPRIWPNDHRVFDDAAAAAATPQGLSTVVFFREAHLSDKTPTNLYINNRYLNSLLPSGYAQHLVCPGQVLIGAIVGDAALNHTGRQSANRTYQLSSGKTYYFLVKNVPGSATAALSNVSAAQVSLSDYRRQIHPVPRVPQCGGAKAS